MSNVQFSDLSYKITKELTATIKKNNGIYFTPSNIINKSLDYISEYIENNKLIIKKILEPSCGSCEYVTRIDKLFKNINMDCIEFNDDIYNSIKDLKFDNKTNIIKYDFLHYNNDTKYDLIIGNPPYYVIANNDIDIDYKKYFTGRANIYILFIIHSLFKLNENGIMSFVIPKNFLNCLYYNKLRVYINNNFKILNIIDCSNEIYIDTLQDTIIFIIQKTNINATKLKNNNNKFILNINNNLAYNTIDNIKILKNLCNDSTTLYDLNFKAKIGTVVWNQVKNLLTDDETNTRLIYNSDIVNNTLIKKIYKNTVKKNYINKDGNTNTIIVVNRGYGKGSYTFNYCIINQDTPYLIENHLICIESMNENINNNDDLIDLYNKIVTSFSNEKTKKFISIYFGNNAINATELLNVLPIYI